MYDFDFPVLYLRGASDEMVGGLSDADFVISVPGTQSREIDGPHLLAQARPAEVADALRVLLGRAAKFDAAAQ